jgi:uncharacterized integral membrane protein
MKLLSALFSLAILAVVLCFVLSNQQDVTLTMWPFAGSLQFPLYLMGLIPLLVGLVAGGLWGWMSSVPHRLKIRQLNKEIHLQKQEAVENYLPPRHKKYFWER